MTAPAESTTKRKPKGRTSSSSESTPTIQPTLTTQPINNVVWVDPATLRANDYNPNHVFPPEMALLKLSILEDGWTQPIVVRPDGEIVDGFHRWTLGSRDRDVREMTGGLVPVVYTRNTAPDEQRLSTIRHNRARGEHYVLKMANIVADLVRAGMTKEDVCRRLGMEDEEYDRLIDRSGMIGQRGTGGTDAFNKGWVSG